MSKWHYKRFLFTIERAIFTKHKNYFSLYFYIPIQLSLDTIDSQRRGIYVCSTDFSANKKLLVSYKSGDELTVIEVAKQYRQPGKMVVQNNRDGKGRH